MKRYEKTFFDQCLVAIVAELERLENPEMQWPNEPADAAGLIYSQAESLFAAAARMKSGPEADDYPVLKAAVRTGAMALKFLLSMKHDPKYAQARIRWEDEREFVHHYYLDDE
jgi:hypothetical protein